MRQSFPNNVPDEIEIFRSHFSKARTATTRRTSSEVFWSRVVQLLIQEFKIDDRHGPSLQRRLVNFTQRNDFGFTMNQRSREFLDWLNSIKASEASDTPWNAALSGYLFPSEDSKVGHNFLRSAGISIRPPEAELQEGTFHDIDFMSRIDVSSSDRPGGKPLHVDVALYRGLQCLQK